MSPETIPPYNTCIHRRWLFLYHFKSACSFPSRGTSLLQRHSSHSSTQLWLCLYNRFIPSSALNSRSLTCHTRPRFLSLTLKFSSILVSNDLCLAPSPTPPSSPATRLLFCSSPELTNCISLHLILQGFLKRFVSLTANTWGEATHHTPRGHGHSYRWSS